ncbi:sigma-70 family RNA polymerase sigma factor [Planctomonas sp. JC2975]|uniref:sigma-70 family RNA polymerase sigma factor n=1 Tax=Planctomonas sp. JC2975 TaxID=2729626 RepID=UPI001472CAFD|nr:sigma-70 family RNA polymerase sigma factor [Planctomonas sp. JC2975]NNC10872.1 sigma-70 family RNA polymerase sigma factor [Planctomonas sp. JC2975]
MTDTEWLAEGFERNRPRLRAVAYRVLGSAADADDALQEAWLRLSRADADGVDNLSAWLTTIVARVSLNLLRARRTRREDPLDDGVPDPMVSSLGTTALGHASPEDEMVLADSVGLALQLVLDTLTPAERLAFVLHDMFEVPFDDIATMLERSPAATRQLASRARQRIRGADRSSLASDLGRQREVVDAFFAASRAGRFDDLLGILSPDVVLRSDGGSVLPEATVRRTGREQVAAHARQFHRSDAVLVPVLVNGTAGMVVSLHGHAAAVMAITFSGDTITGIDILADPERVARLGLDAVLN